MAERESILGRGLDWGATIVSMAGALSVLSVYDVAQRIAIRVSLEAHQRTVCSMARNLNRAARLAGTRFRFEGKEHVVAGRAYIIVANHQSLFDIAMTSEYLSELRPRYVSKAELASGIPGVSYNLRHGGSACIDRDDPRQALAAIETLAHRMLTERFSVAIFPEGTRSKDGAMRPFRAPGLRMLCAKASGVDVLPVTVSGGARLFRHNLKPIVRGVTMSYRVHPPMTPPETTDARAFGDFVRRLEQVIRSALPA